MKDSVSQTIPDTYLPDEAYEELVGRLERLVIDPSPLEGTDARSEVIMLLGELGGLWPVSVLEDQKADAAVRDEEDDPATKVKATLHEILMSSGMTDSAIPSTSTLMAQLEAVRERAAAAEQAAKEGRLRD